ncbi:MAG: EamA family transporter [Micropruina sp.]|uniref:DMT family transporter n=1 Tax=Micropruina sp. TaxID=2737536 RepID=UPI0039E6614A
MVGAGVLFGTTGTAQALGPEGMDPLSVGAARQFSGGLLLALIGLVGWLRREGVRLPRPSAKLGWVLLGGAAIMAFQATFFAGTRANGVAVGTVIALGCSPLFAGLFEWLGGTRPSRRWLLATAVAVAGLVLLSGVLGSVGALDPLGLLASVVAGASYAGYAVAAAVLLRRGVHALISTTALLGTSGLIAATILPFTDLGWLAEPRGLVMAAWLGPVTVVAAYLLMGTALRTLSAATAVTLGLAEPITAAALGVLVLGETLTAPQWAGLAAVLAGVLIAGTRGRTRWSSLSRPQGLR